MTLESSQACSRLFTLSPAAAALASERDPGAQPDADVDARREQVQRVGVSLRAVTQHRHRPVLQEGQLGVVMA